MIARLATVAVLLAFVTVPASARDEAPRCGDARVVSYDVKGGCVYEGVAERLDFTIVTLFGDSEMATCRVPFDLHIDNDGAALWIESVYVQEILSQPGACNDINSCRLTLTGKKSQSSPRIPWGGGIEVEAEGRLEADVYMCFDSCAGRFEGEVTMDLERVPGGFRMRARHETLGETGLQITGDWRFRGQLPDVP